MAKSKEPLTLNAVQFSILDCLYFVESFDKIVEETGISRQIVAAELQTLISRRWIQVMVFDPEKQDYIHTAMHDVDHWEDYAFLATKEGLMKHNGH